MTDSQQESAVPQESADNPVEPLSPSPGDQLIEARQRAGMDAQEVADRLKITVDYVRALESCAYDRLPGLTFTRGYIRSYAQLVELDPDLVITQFDQFVGEQAPSYNSATAPMPLIKPPTSPVFRWVSYLVLLTMIGGSLFWWQSRQSEVAETAVTEASDIAELEVVEPTSTEAAESNSEAVIDESAEPVSPIQPAAVPQEIELTASAVVEAEQVTLAPIEDIPVESAQSPVTSQQPVIESVTEPDAVTEAVAISESEAVSDTVTGQLLQIDFNRECWVEVRGESGSVLVASLRTSQTPVSVLISEPVKVLLGDVGAIDRFEFNGEPVVLARHTRGKIANLTLGNE
ncbi:DUF4115 domain-containing protein [Aestuariirhabdus sp. Z084]|uniref:RodZ domain-containing protein n=1 Tax=Aestuariirhabdus haliotis TaxID=2918751 RepID=UPI00201B3996|nr:RodZ domain-containing protein [Aestuariirhabdus haliotis]MCL6415361.1 DUF4115 domain-containing protein [Aestuariirhabdus haliotis]MCL6419117.1 DUF4115 domain-containing protein [Aestuariirhabdus haliotis]